MVFIFDGEYIIFVNVCLKIFIWFNRYDGLRVICLFCYDLDFDFLDGEVDSVIGIEFIVWFMNFVFV